MPDLTELQRLAEGASAGPGESQYTHPRDSNNWQANAAFAAHFDADTAKKLIAVALAAQASVRAWNALDATPVGSFTGKEVPACEAADEALRKALEELKP